MCIWQTLLEIARRAPSPHNVQPWRVRVRSAREAELLLETSRTLPKEDVTGSFIVLTMGIFLEALSIAAANRGLQLAYELQSEPEFYANPRNYEGQTQLSFARLRLTENALIDSPFPDDLFHARRTSRLSYAPDSVPAAAAKAFEELARSCEQLYAQIEDASPIEQIVERNIEAVFEDLNLPDYHDEIVEWFRFMKRQAERTRDGLDYRCMNASRPAFWLSAHAPRLLQLPLSRDLLSRVYRAQFGHAPTIGLLAGKFWQPSDALETGKFPMRFWLEAARHKLYIHPYGNLVTNRRAARWLQDLTGVEGAWLVFKIGFSNEPPQSLRRTTEEILI